MARLACNKLVFYLICALTLWLCTLKTQATSENNAKHRFLTAKRRRVDATDASRIHYSNLNRDIDIISRLGDVLYQSGIFTRLSTEHDEEHHHPPPQHQHHHQQTQQRSSSSKPVNNRVEDTGNNQTHHSYHITVPRVVLNYYGLMVAGAVARSVSAAAVHPLNVIKTILQSSKDSNFGLHLLSWQVLTRGIGAQFFLSIPHGAFNFVITETAKVMLSKISQNSTLAKILPQSVLQPTMDFLSSSISTLLCSVISNPQMVITDRIMAGMHENIFAAVTAITAAERGLAGFYVGWVPALVQKIPSYALTWMFFQQFKRVFKSFTKRSGNTVEMTLLGSLAAACAATLMIPADTIKTRIVLQKSDDPVQYTSMTDCFCKVRSTAVM